MRNRPGQLALFFVMLAVSRVAVFVAVGLSGGMWGYIFAIGVAYGVYVFASFLRHRSTFWSGLVGIAIFMLADLWFNEMELVRVLSTSALIAPDANFLSIPAKYLRYAMQLSALGFGAFQTVATALLGWLQSGASVIPDKELEVPSVWGRVGRAITQAIAGVGIGFAMWFEGRAVVKLAAARSAGQDADNPPIIDGQNGRQVARRPWHSLSAEEVAKIPAMGRAEMQAFFGISDGAAGEWKRKVARGERPWLK